MTTLNLDAFSPVSRNIFERAEKLARKRSHRYVEPVHILISALMHKDTSALSLLQACGANVDALLGDLNRELGLIPQGRTSQVYFSEHVMRATDRARSAMRSASHSEVTPPHLVLAIAQGSRGMAPRLLQRHGAPADVIQRNLQSGGRSTSSGGGRRSLSGSKGAASRRPSKGAFKTEHLDQFADDLTSVADNDGFDPVIGREAELRRLMQILTRRTKNNPILIGEPGVGKVSIIKALCQRISSGDVPEALKECRVYSLNQGKLVAGTGLRGQFEERIQNLMDEIKASDGRAIIFIEDIHNMVGGSGQESGNIANMLKPYLASGDVRCVGTTTAEDFKQHIEEDKGLVRRFQDLAVEEPSTDEAIAILRGIKHKFEIHHHVRITDAAVVSAVKLAQRYITDRCLPDAAVDLLDEAASLLRLEIDSKPNEIDSLERRIQSLEVQRETLEQESTEDAKTERRRIDDEIARLSASVAEMSSHWKLEKDILDRISELQKETDATQTLLEKAKRDNDLGRVSELKRFVLPSLERDIEAQTQRLDEIQRGTRLLKQDVDPNEIADVVSFLTGIPVNKMMEGDREKLLRMEDRLRERVVGQDDAIEAIATAVRRSRAGVSDPNRPIGNFFFVGPTGVGKTELAKALAQFLFDTEKAMIRLDMSEYQEQAKVNTLIGSARGYVGSEKGGVLTEAVRRNPYSVVLFDEAEKAHPKVFDLLLQIMDEGRLTDSQGLEIDFTNTIVIMTSNVGSHKILEMTGKLSNEEMSEQIHEIMRDHFRPEFLARIDDIVVFNALNMEAIDLILRILVKKLNRLLAEQKMSVTFTETAMDWIAEEGFEPEYGARPLKKAVLTHVQDPLAMAILEGRFAKGDIIHVDVDEENDTLTFTKDGEMSGSSEDAPPAGAAASPFEDLGD